LAFLGPLVNVRLTAQFWILFCKRHVIVKFDGTNQAVEATVAIVPNVKVTFYVQPKLVVDAVR